MDGVREKFWGANGERGAGGVRIINRLCGRFANGRVAGKKFKNKKTCRGVTSFNLCIMNSFDFSVFNLFGSQTGNLSKQPFIPAPFPAFS